MAGFIKRNGNVRELLVYKIALRISVITEIFVNRFVNAKSRTVDQMQQAARSCKQNIVEGSEAAATSKETEIKLTNVARASLGELLEDYLDFIRFNNLKRWEKGNPRLERLRAYIKTDDFENDYANLCQRLPPEELCNLAITLIMQCQFLLDRLLKAQEDRFLAEGGIREAMSKARREIRKF
ncbi:MAG: four helix bundle suffix domain-containing protein [Muribaculaceae bacterium]|nr:four helix bundle suffix domain-containing protein [Muribaculaceae bacterium]